MIYFYFHVYVDLNFSVLFIWNQIWKSVREMKHCAGIFADNKWNAEVLSTNWSFCNGYSILL